MRMFIAACVLGFSVAGALYADDKDKKGEKKDAKIDAKLILGKWSPEKLPEGVEKSVSEYLKENQFEVKMTAGGMDLSFKGSYKLDGDKLEVTIEKNGEKETSKRIIRKLTTDELVTYDEEKKLERVFKRVK